jgi:hypothetical protein
MISQPFDNAKHRGTFMADAFFLSAAQTPTGNDLGSLADLSVPDFGASGARLLVTLCYATN